MWEFRFLDKIVLLKFKGEDMDENSEKTKQEFQIFNIVSRTYGGGKTQEIIEKSDGNSLIVSLTITLSKDIKRRNGQGNIIHYHQLIYDTAKRFGMNLRFDSWGIYENESIFEFIKKDSIIMSRYR